MVVKMPRSIGIRWGVKMTSTGSPATSARACSISGVCRWVPTAEAVVGGEVDHPHAAVQEARQRLHADAVRQAAEGTLHPLGYELVSVERLAAQANSTREARVQVTHQRRGVLVPLPGGDGDDFR